MKWASANGFLPALFYALLVGHTLLADSDERDSEKDGPEPVSDEKAKVKTIKITHSHCSVIMVSPVRTTCKSTAT